LTQQSNRFNPSPRYRELIGLYQSLHVEGDKLHDIPADQTFDGQSLIGHVVTIAQLVADFGIQTVLDYGSGKAQGYDNWKGKRSGEPVTGLKAIWGVDDITLYDPAYVPNSTPPTGKFDLVICTDVLEHCPEEDIPWIVGEIFGLSRKFRLLHGGHLSGQEASAQRRKRPLYLEVDCLVESCVRRSLWAPLQSLL
jgi:hypothetical protein